MIFVFKGFEMLRYVFVPTMEEKEKDPFTMRAVTRQKVKSYMITPGYFSLEYRNGERVVPVGSVFLHGRAWTGTGKIIKVEISFDSGKNWIETQLEKDLGSFAWRGFKYFWNTANTIDKRVEIWVKATDSEGNTQPIEAAWNQRGMENNSVQRCYVRVVSKLNLPKKL
jgi:hypothetical protein